MRKIFAAIFSSFLLLNPTFAGSGSTINGTAHLKGEKYDSLTVNGNLTFDDLTIKEGLVVNGNLEGKGLKCAAMKSNGLARLDRIEVGSVKSNGFFRAKNVEIKDSGEFNGGCEIKNGKLPSIQIRGREATLIKCEVNGDLHIKKIEYSCCSCHQRLELRENSVVTGDLLFDLEGGEVYLFGGSKVMGKIVNGKLIER